MKTAIVEGMRCPACSARIEKAFSALGAKASADAKTGKVAISGDLTDDQIRDVIERLGFVLLRVE